MIRMPSISSSPRPGTATRAIGLGITLLSLIAAPTQAAPVSYRNEVVPILFKAGCSMGACHGNATGKGGFKLSLRSEEPEADHRVLTDDWLGRRINLAEPEQSLLLLKACAEVTHEGGQRFRRDSHEYRTLQAWIAEGAHDDVATAPKLESLVVTPLETIVSDPTTEVALHARGPDSAMARSGMSPNAPPTRRRIRWRPSLPTDVRSGRSSVRRWFWSTSSTSMSRFVWASSPPDQPTRGRTPPR